VAGAGQTPVPAQSTFVLGLQTIGGKVLGHGLRLIDNCNKLGDDTGSATASHLYEALRKTSSCDRRGRRLPWPSQ